MRIDTAVGDVEELKLVKQSFETAVLHLVLECPEVGSVL